ncbi:MAG: hypothetical protein CO108_06485 [Deltaproteobacteria bacterium CG_4_9_14_3_um_filter_63_12]|nr:MAG: hypothetical protein COW42_00675 [Deltaproteobacteria bacterium CG17_big_fil_post_rev_8_21_14_2_50_63_7]PJB45908.1 MAG: hypothetical protein CO108_06485 [Deltaproteobacteria bacterium CG_4_9_14_3_um_filter_63_12]
MQHRRGIFVFLIALFLLVLGFGCEGTPKDDSRAATKASIEWNLKHDEALAAAKEAGKPAIIDFTASWCAPCQQLERETFSDPKVIEALQRFATIRVDGSGDMEAVEPFMERHEVVAFPTVVFVDSKGNTMAEPRVTDFVPPAELLLMLDKAK